MANNPYRAFLNSTIEYNIYYIMYTILYNLTCIAYEYSSNSIYWRFLSYSYISKSAVTPFFQTIVAMAKILELFLFIFFERYSRSS